MPPCNSTIIDFFVYLPPPLFPINTFPLPPYFILTFHFHFQLTTKASEIAKLQSELEKSEAERQNLEYELLKVIQDQNLASDHAAKLNTKLETENSKLKGNLGSC